MLAASPGRIATIARNLKALQPKLPFCTTEVKSNVCKKGFLHLAFWHKARKNKKQCRNGETLSQSTDRGGTFENKC